MSARRRAGPWQSDAAWAVRVDSGYPPPGPHVCRCRCRPVAAMV